MELYYEYEAIQEEDVARGVSWVFVPTLGSFLGMVGVAFYTYDGHFKPRDAARQPRLAPSPRPWRPVLPPVSSSTECVRESATVEGVVHSRQ